MINIFYMDRDLLFYNDLGSWLPDFCSLQQIKVESIDTFPAFNHISDILLINPEYTGTSIELLKPILIKLTNIPVIFISETISLPFVVAMVKNGAYSFLHKKRDKSILIECIKEIIYKNPIEKDMCNFDHSSIKDIIGNSIPIINLKKEIINFKGNNLNVHLYGETGTGKELTAKALHLHGNQHKKPMVAVNCGAIPENLIESELFGSVKGAYTDAQNRDGLFDKANGTTILLDEIGELSKSAQVKLLRVLEDGIFSKIGDSTERKSVFNLITATNKNLKKEVTEGRFREDLYYRITSLILTVPPLRERKEDIYDLSQFFLKEHGSSKKLSHGALSKLLEYNWPGNIRELKQTVIRAEYLSRENQWIEPLHIIFY